MGFQSPLQLKYLEILFKVRYSHNHILSSGSTMTLPYSTRQRIRSDFPWHADFRFGAVAH